MGTSAKKSSKVFVTLATGSYVEMLEMASVTFKKYCYLWNYDYIEIRESLDKARPDAWSKLLAIRKLLDNYDFVLYVDSDAIILDFESDLELEITQQTDFTWALCQTQFGELAPNAGVMGFRSNERTKAMIDLAYMQEDLIFNGWWEQAALMRVLKYEDVRKGEKHWSCFNLPELGVRVTEISPRWNSTIFDVDKDPIIRHFAGDAISVKKLLMADYLLRNSFILESSNKNLRAMFKSVYVGAKEELEISSQSQHKRIWIRILKLLLRFKIIKQIKWR
jgi:hypothetical protein